MGGQEKGYTYSRGAAHGKGNYAFANGERLSDGRVVMFPYYSADIGVYNPTSNSITFCAHGGGGGGRAYTGGCVVNDNLVVLAPTLNSTTVGRYNPSNNTFSAGVAHGQGSNAFSGAVKLNNGNVVLIPASSQNICIYNPTNNTIQAVCNVGVGNAKYWGGELLSDGRVLFYTYANKYPAIFNPSNNTLFVSSQYLGSANNPFTGGAVIDGGKAILAPNSVTDVGSYNYVNDIVSLSGSVTAAAGTSGAQLFMSATKMADGRVMLIAHTSLYFVVYNPVKNTITRSASRTEVTYAFWGGVLLSDGRIVCIPYNSLYVGLLS
jgi:hypothetical protein